MKTEHTQEFQEKLSRDNLVFIHSVLQAHSPTYSLLNSVVYWCSQHWLRSQTQYSTDRFTRSTLFSSSARFPSLCNVHIGI